MDIISIKPEGMLDVLSDQDIEDLEEYYQKQIQDVTDDEINAYEDAMRDEANSLNV